VLKEEKSIGRIRIAIQRDKLCTLDSKEEVLKLNEMNQSNLKKCYVLDCFIYKC
jgi:hypothetical protein